MRTRQEIFGSNTLTVETRDGREGGGGGEGEGVLFVVGCLMSQQLARVSQRRGEERGDAVRTSLE